MSAYSWLSVLAQGTDAEFRAWGGELNAAFAAVGLVQTADSGQINWATVTRAGATTTAAGYEIWRTADSSLYYKVEYGSSYGIDWPCVWLTVGQGSNGSGTLTGQTSTRSCISYANLPNSSSTPYMSYVSASNSHLTLVWKVGAGNGSFPFAIATVGKTVDSSGAVVSTGYAVLCLSSVSTTISMQCVRTAAVAATRTAQTSMWVAVPGQPASSLVGADIQTYLIWMDMPEVMPFAWGSVFLRSELPPYTTVSVALVGTTSHTYLVLGQAVQASIATLPSASYSLLLCYE